MDIIMTHLLLHVETVKVIVLTAVIQQIAFIVIQDIISI